MPCPIARSDSHARDPAIGVRERVAATLGEMKNPAAIERLVEALKDGTPTSELRLSKPFERLLTPVRLSRLSRRSETPTPRSDIRLSKHWES
jgi:HEAT repeat protein